MAFSKLTVALLAGLVVVSPAYAYLDPNASSVLLQVILGGVAGVAIALRLLWSRIRAAFTRGGSTPEAEPRER